MNRTLKLLAPAFAVGMVATTNAATILIDYIDSDVNNGIHDTAVNNGGFESGTTSVPTIWTALKNGRTIERIGNNANSGTYSLVVSQNGGAAINTGHTITNGEQFELSFNVKGALNADNTDKINWVLFYTDTNANSGTATTLFSGEVTLVGATADANTSPYQASRISISTLAAAAVPAGRNLFLKFEGGSGIDATEYARVDSVFLSVPEPSSAALAVLALGSASLIRRRRL